MLFKHVFFTVPAHINIIYLFTGAEDGSKFIVSKTATFSRGEAKRNSCCRGGEVKQTWCQVNINFVFSLKLRNRFKFWFFCFVTVVIFWIFVFHFLGELRVKRINNNHNKPWNKLKSVISPLFLSSYCNGSSNQNLFDV